MLMILVVWYKIGCFVGDICLVMLDKKWYIWFLLVEVDAEDVKDEN